jgi:hypothetical protein
MKRRLLDRTGERRFCAGINEVRNRCTNGVG